MTACGNVLFQTGRIEEGETWIRRALRIHQRQSGENSSGVADCLYRQGTMYVRTGQYAEAETMLRQTLEIARHARWW